MSIHYYPLLALAIVVVAVVLGTRLFMAKAQKTEQTAEISNTVLLFTLAGGLLAAGVAMSFSVAFGLSLSDNPFMSVAIALIFVAWGIAQFSSAHWLGYHGKNAHMTGVIVSCVLFIGGMSTSWLAGQSFLSTQVDRIEAQRRAADDTYKAAIATRENAANNAASLAVSKETADAAQASLDKLQKQLERYQQSDAKNASGANVGTVSSVIAKYGCGGYYAGYCAEVKRIQSEMVEHRETLSNYRAYQGAKTHAESLEATPLPKNEGAAAMPGFVTISNLTGYPVELVRSAFNGWFGFAADLAGVLLLWLAGSHSARQRASKLAGKLQALIAAGYSENDAIAILANRADASGATIPAARVKLNEPVPAMDVGGYVLADGLAHVHAGEVVVPAHEVEAYQQWKAEKSAPPMPEPAQAQKAGNRQAANPEVSEPCYRARALEILATSWSNDKDISQNKCRRLLGEGGIKMNTMAMNNLIKSVIAELRSGENV